MAPGLHPADVLPHANYDLHRLETQEEGKGWQIKLPNALAAVHFGKEKEIMVYSLPGDRCSKKVTPTLKAVSGSKPEARDPAA